MKQQDFENRHQTDWHSLSDLNSEAKPTHADKSADMPRLYRKVCHGLALTKQRQYSHYLVNRLNQIAMDSHQHLYRYNSFHHFQILRFILFTFPQTLRRNATYVWIATTLFLLPGLLMWLLCSTNEELIYSVMPIDQVKQFESMYEPGADSFGEERDSESDIVMFGFYIKNNIGISFRTFAGGILFGIGTIFFLVYNGIHIGAAAGHMTQVGYVDTFFPFVVGHGSFELTAIVFSGAAGLMLGNALLNPGQYSRLDALRTAGKEAIIIVYGAAAMLLVAAFIEAFWSSSSSVSIEIKYTVGAALWALVLVYCFFSGRGRQ